MANEQDLISEIDRALDSSQENFRILSENGSPCVWLAEIEITLQRARDALRWIPCEERLPEKEGYYLVTFETGSVEIDYFIPGHGFDCSPSCPVIAWKERTILSAYTPEEK